MKFDALRRLSTRLAIAASAVATSVILGSCGGGGAASNNEVNGALTLLPSAISIYPGVPYTFQIAGGRPPYLLSSSEPVIFPVPAQVSGHSFQVVANNPGVIDANLPPGSLPIRSVVVTIRDSFGTVFSTATQNGITVGQNFLTGYGITFDAVCSSGQACSGQDAVIHLQSVTNGALYGNRAVRFCVVKGDFQFVIPATASQPETLANCYDTATDHAGNALARIRVPASAPSQIAVLRVFDTATGAYVDELFSIVSGGVAGSLTVIPNDFTFTGPRQGVCGTGSSDILVFDGNPPYSATSSDPNIQVTPSSTSANPGKFTITASNPNVCVDKVSVIITDASLRRATVTVTTEAGSTAPPAMVVSPTTVTLNDTCGYSTSVTAVGGAGSILANSTHPRVTAVVSGNTVTITRALHDPASPPGPAFYPATANVSVTDGTTVSSVTVNGVATFCP